jgi:hypothetical protein
VSEEEQKMFVDKKIKDIDVNGFYVFLSLEDGTELFYNATDGGYSSWEIQQKSKGYINCNEIERLENIIKEARKEVRIYEEQSNDGTTNELDNYVFVQRLKNVLDKENKE